MRGNTRIVVGLLFIVGGFFYLLQNLGYLSGNFVDIFWALMLGVGSGVLFRIYSADRRAWWFALPAIMLAGFAVSNLLDIFLPSLSGTVSGLISLGGMSAAFFFVYYTDRMNWWAVIPGGVLLTLGLIDLLDGLGLSGFGSGGLLFVGIGLTFLTLYFLPSPYGRLNWAIWPALGLFLFGGFVGLGETALFDYLWPLVIILVGVVFLFAALRRRPSV